MPLASIAKNCYVRAAHCTERGFAIDQKTPRGADEITPLSELISQKNFEKTLEI